MQKLLLLLILLLPIYADTSNLLSNILNGLNIVKSARKWEYQFPTKSEQNQIVKIIDSFCEKHTNITPTHIFALYASESRLNKNAMSGKAATGICQLTPSTKDLLLKQAKETNEHSCVQDVRLSLRLILEINWSLSRTFNPKFENIVWAYNAGVGRVLNNGWYTNKRIVYLQPKVLANSVKYYYENYKVGVFDIDYDFPGWRYELNKQDEQAIFRGYEKFHKIFITLNKYVLVVGNNTFPIGIGEIQPSTKRTATPVGNFRVIWKMSYAGKEGGAYGVGAVRLNYKFVSGKSCYIHGTDEPDSIGKNSSGGCIRLFNKDMLKLLETLEIGDYVYISN